MEPQTQDIQLMDAINQYGKPKLISLSEAAHAFNQRNKGLVTLVFDEAKFESTNLPKDRLLRFADEYAWILPGYVICNARERYLFPNPIPANVRIVGLDPWPLIYQKDKEETDRMRQSQS